MPRHLIPGDVTIRSIKPGDKRNRLADGSGLYLLLFVKGGSHGWRFDYTFAGVRKTLSLGTYPAVGLADARRRADEARSMVARGEDPSGVRKAAKAAVEKEREARKQADAGMPMPGTFEAVAREWLERKHAKEVSQGHNERTRIRLEQDVFPWIGARRISEVKASDVLACVRRVEARGALETAHRLISICGQVFRHGIANTLCERDVAYDLRDALPATRVTHLAAITDPARVGELLRAIDAYKGHGVTRAALQLAPLVLLRPGELRRAEWSEFDLGAGVWNVPGERMKRRKTEKLNGGPHLVPLSRQAVEILLDLQPLTGTGRYVFPGLRSRERPMSDAAILAALRRMGFPADEMTGHGFRAMARTMLAERLDVEVQVIEAQLAHAVGDALGRAYNRTQFKAQRQAMMQTWADYLDRLKQGGEVVALPVRASA